MGIPALFWGIFILEKKDKSGSVSIQIVSRASGKYKAEKTVGSSFSTEGIAILKQQVRHELSMIQKQSSLFVSQDDTNIEGFLNTLKNSDISVIGPELIFGKIFNHIGFNAINEPLFRHLVIARLAFPLSKLKTLDYLSRFQGVQLNISSIYLFLDTLNKRLKEHIEQIAFKHTLQLHHGTIGIVFYDMTTLYF